MDLASFRLLDLWDSYGRAIRVSVALGAEYSRRLRRRAFGSMHLTVQKGQVLKARADNGSAAARI